MDSFITFKHVDTHIIKNGLYLFYEGMNMNENDSRVIKTKLNIHHAFIKLFSKKSFEDISVKEIADVAQVSRKTFYLHYLDKYDLLDRLVSLKLDKLEEICEKKKELGVQEGTQLWFRFFEENKTFFMKLFNTLNASNYKKRLLNFIEQEFKKKISRNDVIEKGIDYDVYISFISSGIVGLLDMYLDEIETDKDKIVNQVVKLLSLYNLYESDQKII